MTRDEYITLLRQHAQEMQQQYELQSMTVFGSVARGDNTPVSDIDLCVEMPPKAFNMVRLKRFLENLLNCSVDLVRRHKHMNPLLLQQIQQDGTNIF